METNKRNFLVITEVGRKRNVISFHISEIMPNKGLRLIDNDYVCSLSSNRGTHHEAVQALVNKKELPENALTTSGYIDFNILQKDYNLIMIDGKGLNYVSQY